MEGNISAIMMQGITRNATKIGVKDGQAEDLINLRFMDGSWRASGDGRLIDFTMDRAYTQLYVHTNVYRHLLGVYDGTLYWFAEIGTDGVTFYPLDNTTSRTSWPEDYQSMPTAPVALTSVTGDIWITQTGHLLTIIDESDDFEYFVFRTDNNTYYETDIDVNSKPSSRGISPFGQVHFNIHCPRPDILFEHRTIDIGRAADSRYFKEIDLDTSKHKYVAIKQIPSDTDTDTWRNLYIAALGELTERNVFSGAFLACVAIRLYDGSYAYASNPVLIYPRQQSSDKKLYFEKNGSSYDIKKITSAPSYDSYAANYPIRGWTEETDGVHRQLIYVTDYMPDSYHIKYKVQLSQFTIASGNNLGISSFDCDDDILPTSLLVSQTGGDNAQYLATLGFDLMFSIEDIDILKKNKDIFTHICIFITPEFGITECNNKDMTFGTAMMMPRKHEDLIYDLLHSPMFLLKEYSIDDLSTIKENVLIDLTRREDEGLLQHDNIVQQERLPIEASMRTTYLPKVSYMYNGRLHIANYKSYPFFGYPIDLFQLHNHSVKVQDGSWFKGVLPNLTGNNDEYLQYVKEEYNFPATYPTELEYFAYVTVKIDSSQGDQKVVRYIAPYDISTPENGRADFIEALNPILTYPDSRAKEMTIVIYRYQATPRQIICAKTFTLKPHPYLNMAYYIDPELKPIVMGIETSMGSLKVPKMQNVEEYFPNGLKVSKTDNPMFFPVENTYQVGSAEILALMSNTLAVGTGQTGDAPLYVFCKDGVYALFVDASGQMAYPNSRALARDVCNNPRSVTPIDAGVVFTTDRGLMMISGEQVQEIGATAEGDVLKYAVLDANNEPAYKEFMKTANLALRKVAELPDVVTTTDFLTYLKGAIVNYNHNMRELMVSNPEYAYSYVMDRDYNWSRRDYTAKEYVNNYPTSYRLTESGQLYKVDEEGDDNTSLEERKEADNKIFYLSNVIKLDTIHFKQAYRFVVRGYFEAKSKKRVGIYVLGSYDGRKWARLGRNEREGYFTDIGCRVEHTDMRFFRVCIAGQVSGKTRIDYMEMSADGSMLNTKIR